MQIETTLGLSLILIKITKLPKMWINTGNDVGKHTVPASLYQLDTSFGYFGKRTLTEKMSPPDWPVGKDMGHFS